MAGGAGVAIGADGLIVEVHPAPEKAISGGANRWTSRNSKK
jgi:3-deoxy-D-arabino-heptulosonate 7-phosphate (DAHP) synthase